MHYVALTSVPTIDKGPMQVICWLTYMLKIINDSVSQKEEQTAESNNTLIRFPTHLCGMLRYPLLLRYDLRSVLSPQLSVWIFFDPTRIRAWTLLAPPELKGILWDLSDKGSSNFFKALFATLAKVSRGCIAHLNEFNCTPLCSPSCLSTV